MQRRMTQTDLGNTTYLQVNMKNAAGSDYYRQMQKARKKYANK